MPRIRTLVLALLPLVCASALAAQQRSGGREAMYRCKDQSGQIHTGDSVPAPCIGRDTEVLNDRGMLLRTIEGERTRAERLAREAEEAQARKARNEALQRDRMLIDTYLTVADIERLRDQRLALLVAQYKITEQNIANLKDRQQRLRGEVARFKPYSDNPKAPPLPDHLAEEMVNTVNGMRVYQETLENNSREQAEIAASFASDIKRFKELKGLQ